MKLVFTLLGFLFLTLPLQGQIAFGKEQPDEYVQDLKTAGPKEVLRLYQKVLEKADMRPELSIYTKETREWKKSWDVTSTQMANEASALAQCSLSETKTNSTHAVVRSHPEKERKCPPYFLKWEDGAWRLDFLSMMKVIVFNHKNEWHFKMRKGHPYEFAFKDYYLDKNGFPFLKE